jgi:hypothetical protein
MYTYIYLYTYIGVDTFTYSATDCPATHKNWALSPGEVRVNTVPVMISGEVSVSRHTMHRIKLSEWYVLIIYTYIYICIYSYIHIFIYIYIYMYFVTPSLDFVTPSLESFLMRHRDHSSSLSLSLRRTQLMRTFL